MKKICFITGTRAEYGLLSPLMQAVKNHHAFELQILVTGMHLSPEFGLTYQAIEADGFQIDEKVEMLLSSDSSAGIVKSTGLGMIGFADALQRLKPDFVAILGDRFEAFSAATSAYLMKIPIIHLHGGETTEGATDEALRHAITKMSYLHFTSTEEYRNRVIQLGENPARVYNVGAIGLDNILKMKLLSKNDLSESLNVDLTKPYFLITFHPVTLEKLSSEIQLNNFLKALAQFPDYQLIFTRPNADADGRIIIEKLKEYVSQNPERAFAFTSLGQLRYLSAIKYATAVVGNSSSGIIEAPSFQIPTVNIGNRQGGRASAETVIHCDIDEISIIEAITKAISDEFQQFCKTVPNIYGNGATTEKIIQILENIQEINLQKPFYNIPKSSERAKSIT